MWLRTCAMRWLIVPAVLSLLALGAACGDKGPAANRRPSPATTPSAKETAWFSGNFLATTNRDRLSICVDGAAGNEVRDADVDKVAASLQAAASELGDYAWAKGLLEQAQVVRGCPIPTVPLGSLLRYDQGASSYAVRTANPSAHRVFVYLVSERTYAATFRKEPFVTAAAEMFGQGDNIAEVTTAVYAKRNIGGADLRAALLRSLGLPQ